MPLNYKVRNTSTPDHYDAAVFCGGLAQGHIKLDVFTDIIRIVKNGKYHFTLLVHIIYSIPKLQTMCIPNLFATFSGH